MLSHSRDVVIRGDDDIRGDVCTQSAERIRSQNSDNCSTAQNPT